ncbi:hypothetical protein BDEG_25434 [Batrachochytrium dendrobatidis JEL423]|uniref:Uncharacterized protein n=1 Tax=Batrachochytrium dendrobatidis (strain JEL423) TaxID=403673 RepID=A0A177WQF4_BATDL|nr:hypothetical protein BDEG_25434 [Batrachochytrium dendrobatidis JEL423]
MFEAFLAQPGNRSINRHLHDTLLQTVRMELLGSKSPDQAAKLVSFLLQTWRMPTLSEPIPGRATAIEMAWKTGIHILRSKASSRDCLEENTMQSDLAVESDEHTTAAETEMAKKIISFLFSVTTVESKQKSRELVLEWALYCIRFGNLKPAYERLERYIGSTATRYFELCYVKFTAHYIFGSLIALHPYNEHSLLIGCAGIISFLIWKQEGSYLTDTHFFRQATSHLEESLLLDPTADMFSLLLETMYKFDHQFATLEALLVRMHISNPDNPNTARRLLEFYRMPDQEDIYKQKWVTYAEKLLELDPLMDPAVALEPLVSFYKSTNSPESIVKILSNRLDYGMGTTWMWEELCNHLDADSIDPNHWEDRIQWWPALHFYETPPLVPQELFDYLKRRGIQLQFAQKTFKTEWLYKNLGIPWNLGFENRQFNIKTILTKRISTYQKKSGIFPPLKLATKLRRMPPKKESLRQSTRISDKRQERRSRKANAAKSRK